MTAHATIHRFLAILLFALVTAHGAHAADFETSSGVAGALQARYETITSFTAAFTQSLTSSATGVAEARSGTIAFRQPGLVRWETLKPEKELLVVGKSAVWNYFSEERVAYKYELSTIMNSKTMLRFVTGQARLDEDFELSPPSAPDEDGLVRMELLPLEPEPSMVQANIWVDPATSLLRRVQIFDFYGNENLLEFADIDVNAAIPDKKFTFTPPKGTEILDDTQALEPVVLEPPK